MDINDNKKQKQKIKDNYTNSNETIAKNSRPYMGNITSGEIGNMAREGMLGGEMVKRMVKNQEEKMTKENNINNIDQIND